MHIGICRMCFETPQYHESGYGSQDKIGKKLAIFARRMLSDVLIKVIRYALMYYVLLRVLQVEMLNFLIGLPRH